MASAAIFAREAGALIRQQNAGQLAQRLSVHSVDSSKKQFLDFLKTKNYQAGLYECEKVLSGDWAEVICHCMKAALGKRENNLSDAFTHQEAAVEAFLRVFKTLSRAWLPILKVLLVDLRHVGSTADRQLKADGKAEDANKLEGSGRVMRKCLAQELRDEENEKENSRTWGALYVANQCNKVFFALNTLKHVKSLVLPAQITLHEYPAADRVTWYYFQGRMALMEARMDQAEGDLSFAFTNCPPAQTHNRRLILSYLVPVRMILHQAKPSPTRRAALPTEGLLNKYKLPEYLKLVSSFRSGNIKEFDEALEENQDFYIQKAVYMLLFKLKLCVYRNLFKKAYQVLNKSQIKLETFVCAVKACGGEADPEQVECMLANLIHQGLVKGYIAHKQQTVVLKKDDPFRVEG